MTLVRELAGQIAARGTRKVFGITGGGATLTLVNELEALGVEPVRTQFEGTASLMAGTVGRLSGFAGVAFCIKGPGVANMIPGLAASNFEGFPLVAISEAYPPDSPVERSHKRMNHISLTSEVVKGVRYLSDCGPDFNAMAQWAENEVPGPVLLQLADVRLSPVENVPRPKFRPTEYTEVLRLVEAANRSIVIAGTYAIRAALEEKLANLRVPVFSTAAAKGVIDERGRYSAGVYTGVGLELAPESAIIQEADLIIGVGLRPGEVLAVQPFPCVAVNIDPVIISGAAAFQFAATASELTGEIWSALLGQCWGGDSIKDARVRLRDVACDGFLPGSVFRSLATALGPDVRMVLDTGYFCTIGEHVWPAANSRLCLMAGQGRYMGTVVPMALGAAIQDPQTPVLAVSGDGGIGMYVGEVRLAVERKLPVLFILMTDGRFGSIATRAIADNLSESAITIADPSWRSVMDGFGMPTWVADNRDTLHVALASWRPEDGPGYLEVAFDPVRYERMCAGIR